MPPELVERSDLPERVCLDFKEGIAHEGHTYMPSGLQRELGDGPGPWWCPGRLGDLPEGQQPKDLAEKHPNSMERHGLVDEVLRLRWQRDKLTATIAAFPDAHNAANLAHARAERDALRAEVARVRAEVAEQIALAIEAKKPSVKQFWDALDARTVYVLNDAAKVAREHAGKRLDSPAGRLDRVWWLHRCEGLSAGLAWSSVPLAADAPRPVRCDCCGEAANSGEWYEARRVSLPKE